MTRYFCRQIALGGLLAVLIGQAGGCASPLRPPVVQPLLGWSPVHPAYTQASAEAKPLFGHYGTCWMRWPPGWEPCPGRGEPPLIVEPAELEDDPSAEDAVAPPDSEPPAELDAPPAPPQSAAPESPAPESDPSEPGQLPSLPDFPGPPPAPVPGGQDADRAPMLPEGAGLSQPGYIRAASFPPSAAR